MPMDAAAPTLVTEALRLNARYVEEVVIGWELCPWAAHAWRAGRVVRRVFAERAPDPGSLLAFLDALGANPATSIGLAIFPRVEDDAAGWARFAERVRRAARGRAGGGSAAFVLAAFHPDPTGDGIDRGAAALVQLIRRTPDPTLQFVRASAIAAATASDGSVGDRIARENWARIAGPHLRAFRALLDDIRGDRNASYAAL
jgi:hypothetical protein